MGPVGDADMGHDDDRLRAAWSGALYRRNIGHHRRHDPPFARTLEVPDGAHVLDIGCGTGDVTAGLALRHPLATFIGIDASPDMIETARSHQAPNLRFEVERAQDLSYEADFDVVVSIAALHWIPADDQGRVLGAVARALRPRGRFLAEFGGDGNVTATLDAIQRVASGRRFAAHLAGMGNPWFFPTVSQYRGLLGDAGFEPVALELVTQDRVFDRDEFEGWMVSQTLHPWTSALPEPLRMPFTCEAVEAAADAAAKGRRYYATFVRIRVEAEIS